MKLKSLILFLLIPVASFANVGGVTDGGEFMVVCLGILLGMYLIPVLAKKTFFLLKDAFFKLPGAEEWVDQQGGSFFDD